jgi:hypothetical protein
MLTFDGYPMCSDRVLADAPRSPGRERREVETLEQTKPSDAKAILVSFIHFATNTNVFTIVDLRL